MLLFDVLISAVGENLGSKAHGENLEGSFFVLKFEHFFTLRPYLCTEMVSFRESVILSCERFVKGFRLICLPLYSDLIWVRGLTPSVLQIFFHLPRRTIISDWRPNIFNDFVKIVTNVIANIKNL